MTSQEKEKQRKQEVAPLAKGWSDHHHAAKRICDRVHELYLLSARKACPGVNHSLGCGGSMVFGIRLLELQNQSPNLPCKCITILRSSGSSLGPQQQQKQWAKNDNYALSGFSGKKVLLRQTGAFGTLL